jgi:hypothetical protein
MVAIRLVGEEHPGAALVASGLTAVGFVGTLWLAPKLLTVSPRPARRGTARRALLRLYRFFVGNGDAMRAGSTLGGKTHTPAVPHTKPRAGWRPLK